MLKYYLEFWLQSGLFTQLICSNSIEGSVSLNWYCLYFIGVNCMVTAFPEKIKSVFLNIFDKVAAFNRHHQSQLLLAQIVRNRQAIHAPIAYTQESSHEARLLMIRGNLQEYFLQLQFRAIQLIAPCSLFEFLCI